MASMYAPQEAVSSKKIFEKEEYNDLLTAYYEQEGISTETPFQTEYKVESANLNISTKDANIGLEKVYGIISGNSASASEALLSGLMPYMNVELIGEQSHGKYCTGFMLGTSDVYEKVPAAIENWGIYVMVSIYKNANNETPCMPDGLTPDVAASDDPFVMTQLGDVNEAMLKTALTQAGKTYPAEQNSRSMNLRMKEMPMQRKANFGKRILLPATAHIQHQGLTAE
jgi:C-terminal processing protease CtpA/Prc